MAWSIHITRPMIATITTEVAIYLTPTKARKSQYRLERVEILPPAVCYSYLEKSVKHMQRVDFFKAVGPTFHWSNFISHDLGTLT